MQVILEVIAVPSARCLENANKRLTAFQSLIRIIEDKANEVVKIVFIKESGKLKCYFEISNDYLDIVKSTFKSYGFIIRLAENIPSYSIRTAIYRKVLVTIEKNEKALSISQLSDIYTSPTLYYLLTNCSDGSGLLFIFSSVDDRSRTIKLSYTQKFLSGYQLYDSDIISNIYQNSSNIRVMCYSLGTNEEQGSIAYGLVAMCNGFDLSVLPAPISSNDYSINTLFDRFALSKLLNNTILSPLTYYYTADELLVYLALIEYISMHPSFDKNLNSLWELDVAPYYSNSDSSIEIGTCLYSDNSYYLSRRKMRQGLLIVGAPGSGKGNQLFKIIEQLKDVPLLIFESAKKEMHHLIKALPDLKTWRPVPGEFMLNPFEIPPELTLSEYRASLIQMLNVCFRLDGPLEELFTSVLNRCFYSSNYTENSKITDDGIARWGLNEFIIEYIDMISKSGYSDKTKDDMRQAGITRLKSLFDENPDVFDTNHSVPITDLLNGHNLIQLNSLPTVDAKQSFATMLLISIAAYMQLRFQHCQNQDELRLVIILDESHNLLKSVNSSNDIPYSFSDDFANLMLTLRSVGVGFIISDQTTANIPKIIADTCDSKIFMGSSKYSGIRDYLDYLGASDNLLNELYRIKPGQGVFSTSEAPHCVFFTNPLIIADYLNKSCEYNNPFSKANSEEKVASFMECMDCPLYKSLRCTLELKQTSRREAQQLSLKYGNPLLWKNGVNKCSKNDIIKNIPKFISDNIRSHPKYCSFIQWIRLCNREYQKPFSKEDIRKMFDTFIDLNNSTEV